MTIFFCFVNVLKKVIKRYTNANFIACQASRVDSLREVTETQYGTVGIVAVHQVYEQFVTSAQTTKATNCSSTPGLRAIRYICTNNKSDEL